MKHQWLNAKNLKYLLPQVLPFSRKIDVWLQDWVKNDGGRAFHYAIERDQHVDLRLKNNLYHLWLNSDGSIQWNKRYGSELKYSCLIFEINGMTGHIPLAYLLKGYASIIDAYQCYTHAVKSKDGIKIYTGITKQGWQTRYKQHLYSANTGSHLLFHQALRDSHSVHHVVHGAGLTYSKAMDWEEKIVAHTLYPKGLNMIPGGFAGLAYLHKIGATAERKKRLRSEDVEGVINNFFESRKQEGRPNPLMAAQWKDDDFASNIICSNPNNFNLEQVRQIRFMASLGHSVNDISKFIGGSGELTPFMIRDRVERLIKGKTYGRVS